VTEEGVTFTLFNAARATSVFREFTPCRLQTEENINAHAAVEIITYRNYRKSFDGACE